MLSDTEPYSLIILKPNHAMLLANAYWYTSTDLVMLCVLYA